MRISVAGLGWVTVGGGLLLVAGCPNGQPTGAEVAQILPAAVAIDISALPEDEEGVTQQAAPSRNEYQRSVRSTSTIVYRFQDLADRALALAATIHEDIASWDQTQVSGSFTVDGNTFAYKADFSAFDFDGDGNLDGSGNATTEPVALRLWTQRDGTWRQFLCALVTHRPTTANLGAGAMYFALYAVDGSVPEDVHILVEWDRTASEHKWNQAYLQGQIHPDYAIDNGMARVDARLEGGEVTTTVRGAHNYTANPYGLNQFQSTSIYAVGGAYLQVSAQATGGFLQLSFGDTCVDLATLTGTDSANCADLDTQDQEYLDLPSSGQADFPAGFAATPIF